MGLKEIKIIIKLGEQTVNLDALTADEKRSMAQRINDTALGAVGYRRKHENHN